MSAAFELVLAEHDGRRVLLSPSVGRFLALVPAGATASPGDVIGLLCVLGREHELCLPTAAGTCFARPPAREVRRAEVGFGDVLFELEPLGAAEAASSRGDAAASGAVRTGDAEGGIAVRATQTGRFYDRSAPDRPPFVRIGDELHLGQPIGLIEVMKTFNQVTYGGAGLPARARVLSIRCGNETEVRRGEELLRVEALA